MRWYLGCEKQRKSIVNGATNRIYMIWGTWIVNLYIKSLMRQEIFTNLFRELIFQKALHVFSYAPIILRNWNVIWIKGGVLSLNFWRKGYQNKLYMFDDSDC